MIQDAIKAKAQINAAILFAQRFANVADLEAEMNVATSGKDMRRFLGLADLRFRQIDTARRDVGEAHLVRAGNRAAHPGARAAAQIQNADPPGPGQSQPVQARSEEHTSELQSRRE